MAEAKLAWKDLSIILQKPKGNDKMILEGLTGYAEPGTMTAVMGPSGSGKSTLLDALAGRLESCMTVRGDIVLNGHKMKLSHGIAAYVTQDDILLPTLTVKETILYTALLRLPYDMVDEAKQEIMEKVIEDMGLKDCLNTPIGNWHTRGLSGGERRRVSIASEILARPSLLFLDEPTSGLDSASAFSITQTLQRLANNGRTIVASIHQPSNEIFGLFDNLCLLSNGRNIYFGDAMEACEYFRMVGFPCPQLRNPSDHFLNIINSGFAKAEKEEKGVKREGCTVDAISFLVQAYESSVVARTTYMNVQILSQTKGQMLKSSGTSSSFWMQWTTLTKRSFKNMYRDIGYYWIRVLMYAMVSVCIGTIFYKLGTDYKSIEARSTCMANIWIFLTFMAIGGFPSFLEDIKVFYHEHISGHYSIMAFIISNFIASLPFLFLISLTSSSIVYFLVQLHPGLNHFLYFIFGLLTCVVVVESLMMVIASMVPNYLIGIIVGSGVQTIFMLTGGLLRPVKDLPMFIWRYPLSYISFHHYVLQGMFKNEFLGLEFDNEGQNRPKISGNFVLLKNDISLQHSKWWDIAILLGMAIAYKVLLFLTIKFTREVLPLLRQFIRHKKRPQSVIPLYVDSSPR